MGIIAGRMIFLRTPSTCLHEAGGVEYRLFVLDRCVMKTRNSLVIVSRLSPGLA